MTDPAEIAAGLTEAGRKVLRNMQPDTCMTASEAGAYPATITRLTTPPLNDDLTLAHHPLVKRVHSTSTRPLFWLTETGLAVRAHLQGADNE